MSPLNTLTQYISPFHMFHPFAPSLLSIPLIQNEKGRIVTLSSPSNTFSVRKSGPYPRRAVLWALQIVRTHTSSPFSDIACAFGKAPTICLGVFNRQRANMIFHVLAEKED